MWTDARNDNTECTLNPVLSCTVVTLENIMYWLQPYVTNFHFKNSQSKLKTASILQVILHSN